jgi:hypothetical protein
VIYEPGLVELNKREVRFVLWFIVGTSVPVSFGMALLVSGGYVLLGVLGIALIMIADLYVVLRVRRRAQLRAQSGTETAAIQTPSIERPARVRLLAAIGLALVTLALVLDIVGAPINGVRLIAGLLGAASMLGTGYLMRSKSR